MSEDRIKASHNKYLLDTSAVMTFSEDEPGSDFVSEILNKAKRGSAEVYISFISIMEACYKVQQHYKDEQSAYQMFNYLHHLPLKRIDVDDNLILTSASFKALYSVSLADAWILATAKSLNAKLVHKDPEFEQVKDFVAQIALPYKNIKRGIK